MDQILEDLSSSRTPTLYEECKFQEVEELYSAFLERCGQVEHPKVSDQAKAEALNNRGHAKCVLKTILNVVPPLFLLPFHPPGTSVWTSPAPSATTRPPSRWTPACRWPCTTAGPSTSAWEGWSRRRGTSGGRCTGARTTGTLRRDCERANRRCGRGRRDLVKPSRPFSYLPEAKKCGSVFHLPKFQFHLLLVSC